MEMLLGAAVKNIRDYLINHIEKSKPSGLLNGKAGMLVFLAETEQVFPEGKSYAVLDYYLKKINKKLKQGFRSNSLTEGTGGIFWSKIMITENLPLPAFDDKEAEVALLKKNVLLFLQKQNTDYLHGALGLIKILATENLLNASETDFILDYFYKQALPTPKGISWETRFYHDTPAVHPGLAHGTAGLINVLNDLPAATKGNLIQPAINDLYDRIMVPENKNPEPGFKCPTHFHSWCTSYLGSALILLKFLRLQESWQKHTAVKELIAGRFSTLTATLPVTDLCLCHGTAGLLTMLSRLKQETGLEQTAALQETLLHKTAAIFAHHQTQEPEQIKSEFTEDMSLLTGLSGIGLALLHQIKPNPFLLKLLNIN